MSFRSLSAILLLAAVTAACAPAASTGEPAAGSPSRRPPRRRPTEAAPAEPASAEVAAGPTTYTFVAGETVARFVVDEVLSGNPKTVIGRVTDGVTGSITLDLSAPAEAALGPVEVDLTGLETDNGSNPRPARGDPAARQGREQFATFTATQIDGLPETVTPGTSYELKITGDLTIKGTTRQVTFDATVTPVSADRIEGTASLTVPYADFGVDIPFLPPQVASVEDIVRLEIDFAAAR